METIICATKQELGKRAAEQAATWIREAIAARGSACIIVATGASQFEMLQELVAQPDVDWGKVTAFHLDEYIGIDVTHPASFRKYLLERFVGKLPMRLGAFHGIAPENGAAEECRRIGAMIACEHVGVAFVGIGENGHLAFNDPPADFETEEPFIVVDLDESCRKQQLGEGWFATLDDVPKQAISMSIRQIMKSAAIVCAVPDARKAIAVQRVIEGPVSNLVPASILQNHPRVAMLLDRQSSSLLKGR